MTLEEYIQKYGEVEGTRRWKQNQATKRWKVKNINKTQEYNHNYWVKNKAKINENKAQWCSVNPEKVKEYRHRYAINNPEKKKNRDHQYYIENKSHCRENNKQWLRLHPEYARAHMLLSCYQKYDRIYKKGGTAITTHWIIDNIFTKRCLYCGETDWRKLGCDRINNNKSHTPENVVCCCKECNKKRADKDFLEFAYSIGAKDSEGLVIAL